MDNEKPRKISISDMAIELKETGRSATNAMYGNKMMLLYDKVMMTAGGGSHIAACGAMQSAAYSEARRIAEMGSSVVFNEARRVAEMMRPVVPEMRRQLIEMSNIGRRLADAGIHTARLSQMDAAMYLWREKMDVNFRAAVLPASLTGLDFSGVHSQLNRALDFRHIFAEASVERVNHLQEIAEMALAARATSPELPERPIPLLPPRIKREHTNAAGQFLQSFNQEYEEAKKEAEEEGGYVIVSSRTPSGDLIRVTQVSSIGDNFVLVEGLDQDRRPRRFKANCGGLYLAIEIVPIEEDEGDEDNGDDDLVN